MERDLGSLDYEHIKGTGQVTRAGMVEVRRQLRRVAAHGTILPAEGVVVPHALEAAVTERACPRRRTDAAKINTSARHRRIGYVSAAALLIYCTRLWP